MPWLQIILRMTYGRAIIVHCALCSHKMSGCWWPAVALSPLLLSLSQKGLKHHFYHKVRVIFASWLVSFVWFITSNLPLFSCCCVSRCFCDFFSYVHVYMDWPSNDGWQAGNRPCELCQGTTCGTSHTKQGLLQCVVLFVGSRIWPECQRGTTHQIAAAGWSCQGPRKTPFFWCSASWSTVWGAILCGWPLVCSHNSCCAVFGQKENCPHSCCLQFYLRQ